MSDTVEGHGAPVDTRYANFFRVGSNAFEFLLDFGQEFGDSERPSVDLRIVTSPAHARTLHDLLEQAIRRFEAEFGPIPELGDDASPDRRTSGPHGNGADGARAPLSLLRSAASPVAQPVRAASAPQVPAGETAAGAVDALLALLASLLEEAPFPPEPGDERPPPRVRVVRSRERAVGVGGLRGTEVKAGVGQAALLGGRLEAVVRFELWGDSRDQVLALHEVLHTRLRTRRDDLWRSGILRFALEEASPPEQVGGSWLQAGDYALLYEFRHRAGDEASGLIARIPAQLRGEAEDRTVVTDELVRWDAVGAPELSVRHSARGSNRVRSLVALGHLPDGWDGDEVVISVPSRGVESELRIPSVRDLFARYGTEEPWIQLDGHTYVPAQVPFPNDVYRNEVRIEPGAGFRVRYGAAALDADAVVYMRALQ